MIILRKLYFLTLLAIISTPAAAYYNPEPDALSIRLGAGDTSAYTAVRYACDMGAGHPLTGDDTTGDGSVINPYRTFAKAATGFGSAVGEAVALCRGGVYVVTAAYQIANMSSRAETPLVFRDYMPLTGRSRAAPKIILASTANYFVNFEDSGGADGDEGYAFINLEITGVNVDGQNAIRGYADVDHVTIDNCYIHHMVMPFSISTSVSTPDVRYAAEVINDLTFTSVVDGPDTITRATGVWGANIKRGDGVIVTLSNGNNKTFRVHERVSDTVLSISEGASWEVTAETNTVGVTVEIRKSDGKNTNWEIKNSLFTHHATGVFSSLNEGSIHDSVFDSSGYDRVTFDHSLYLSTSQNFHVYNNIFSNNNLSDGVCKAAVFIMHGVMSGGLIEDNLIYNGGDQVHDTCWGIAFDAGYASYESFTDFIVRRNTILNVGSVGIGCNACVNVEISDNYIASTRASGAANGIKVPDQTDNGVVTYGNPLTSNVSITGNIIEGYGAAASSGTSSSGIYVASTAETEGTFTVTGNEVDNFYSCISSSGSSGATLTITGNTTTNCTTGQQP